MELLGYGNEGSGRGRGYEGYEGDGVKPRKSERWKRDEMRERERRTRRDREHGRPVSTGVCMMGEAPPRLEFPLGLVLAI